MIGGLAAKYWAAARGETAERTNPASSRLDDGKSQVGM